MSTPLSPKFEKLVREATRACLHEDPSEVVREALRTFAEEEEVRQEELDALRQALAEHVLEAAPAELRQSEEAIEDLRSFLSERVWPTSP